MTGCEVGRIEAVEPRLGVALPSVLRQIYLTNDGIFRRDGEWWVIWPLDQLVGHNLSA